MTKTPAIKPISAANAANFARIANRFQWTPTSQKATNTGTFRIIVPYCHNPEAVHSFIHTAGLQINRSSSNDRVELRSYGIEPDQVAAINLRLARIIDRVTTAPIDRIHYRERSVNAIWLEPKPSMDPNELALHLGAMLPAVHQGGNIFMVATPDQYRACAEAIARSCEVNCIKRMPGRSAPLIATAFTTVSADGADYIHDLRRNILDFTPDGSSNADEQDIEFVTSTNNAPLPNLRIIADYTTASPILSLPYSPRNLIQSAQRSGSWHNPIVADIFKNDETHQAIKPIERLPEGHSAIIAANSMIDHVLIKDPTGVNNPVIIRGFFKKTNRETFRTAEVVKRTDFYESNILAMDTVTGDIVEVGKSAEGLQQFMQAYGSAIRHNIDVMYPPTVDTKSAEYAEVGNVVDSISRPLIGKQRHAAIAGAIHLKRNPHLNFFATQGSGKTCTTFAISAGLKASITAVITPSRVVPNWVDEIRAVSPRAIIRIVRNHNPIGTPRQNSNFQLHTNPAPFGRASLEEIRQLFQYATPETPLWIIMKKDSARATYPTSTGLRAVWPHDGQPPQPLHHPLATLVQAEHRVSAKPMPSSSPNALEHPKRLRRNSKGRIYKFDHADIRPNEFAQSEYESDEPTLVCPNCWYPIHNDTRGRNNLREEQRHQSCPSETKHPKFPKLTKEFNQLRNELEADAVEVLVEPPSHTCSMPIKQSVPDRHGRRVYSYGDYFSERMVKQVDLLVIDESQDYKARDTLQGVTTRRMAQRAKRTIALTGTPFGGRVSDFFYQLIAFNPKFTQEFSHSDFSRFNGEYGRQELTETLIASSPPKQNWVRSVRSIPGYHPKLLTYFWDNTIFMDLDDVDVQGILPSFTQHARLIEMDDTFQGATGYSQQSAYAYLDDTLSAALGVSSNTVRGSNGNRRRVYNRASRISNYIQEMLTYPENAWMGTAPRNPETGIPVCTMPPLSQDWLYPKENELLGILERHRNLGRKCLVYCTHTKLRDVTTRLKNIIQKEGFRVLQLSSSIKQEDRAAWLRREAARNDVIICHPKLVETGINLIEYPTIIWYEIDHSMITTEQASARSYRINQTTPVEVYFLAYAGTLQEHALHFIAQKSDVSRTFRGDLSKNGLSAFNPTEDDVREEIARALLKGEYMNSRNSLPSDVNVKALERMFSETNIMAGEAYFLPDATTPPQPDHNLVIASPRRRRQPMPQTFTQPTLGI